MNLRSLSALFDVQKNRRAVLDIAKQLIRRRELLMEMTRRDVVERYAGQWFGWAWALLHPIATVCVFVFIFSAVLKTKFPPTAGLPRDYIAYMLSGLIPWLSMQAALSGASTGLTAHSNLVKQTLFPIEVLPMKLVLGSLVPLAIGLLILLTYMLLFVNAGIPWTILLLPLAIAFHLTFVIGIVLSLCALGAFFRDIKDVVQLYLLLGTYLIPIVYMPGWVPQAFLPFVVANPFSSLIWCYQDVLFYGYIAHPAAWIAAALFSIASLVLGTRIFAKLKPHVADVL